MIEFPEFDPIAVHITETRGLTWYGLMYLAGFVAAWLLARRRARKGRTLDSTGGQRRRRSAGGGLERPGALLPGARDAAGAFAHS